MGRIFQKASVVNAADILAVGMKLKSANEIRTAEIEFLVDTGAAMVCLPKPQIEHLGLLFEKAVTVRTANGIVERNSYSPVRVEMFDRHAIVEVLENDDLTPPLLGYIPLEIMDLQVNPKEQALLPNPAHNGKWLIDCY